MPLLFAYNKVRVSHVKTSKLNCENRIRKAIDSHTCTSNLDITHNHVSHGQNSEIYIWSFSFRSEAEYLKLSFESHIKHAILIHVMAKI